MGKQVSFLSKNWFVFCLLLVVCSGGLGHASLAWLLEIPGLNWIVIAVTMFLMAWPMPFAALQQVLRRPVAPIWGSFVNVGLFPLVAGVMSLVYSPELAGGIIVLGATPCTLASASVWTRRAGGNDVVALIVTMITNGFCFLITPTWVYWQTGASIPQSLFWSTVWQLLWLIVLPILIAQLVRVNYRSANWASRHKAELSVVAQIGLLIIVLLGIIQSAQRLSGQPTVSWLLSAATIIPGMVSLHLVMWWLAFRSAGWIGLSRPDQIAVGFSGSQKTLMVGLAVALQLELSVIPLVIYHIAQLLIGTMVAERLRRSAP